MMNIQQTSELLVINAVVNCSEDVFGVIRFMVHELRDRV